MFRAHGLLAPVWDLPVGTGAGGAGGAGRARSPPTSPRRWPTTPPLTADERAARSGLANRQVTIR